MTHDEREEIARWRLTVILPLIQLRMLYPHDARFRWRQLLAEIAAYWHERSDGSRVSLSRRTIEAWYLAYRSGGVEALLPSARKDHGPGEP